MKNDEFEIIPEKTKDGIKYFLRGRVNSYSADELQHKMNEAIKEGHKLIVLNMMKVEYISSAGIRVILKTYKDANEACSKFGIEMPSHNVKNVLGMTALDELLIS